MAETLSARVGRLEALKATVALLIEKLEKERAEHARERERLQMRLEGMQRSMDEQINVLRSDLAKVRVVTERQARQGALI